MNLDAILDEIEELDYDAAMEYCGDDEEFFIEMLGDYANSGAYEKLKEYYESRDWEQYKITVHALKGTSRMMGFKELGDKCEKLQFAAADKDEAFLSANHDVMMNDLANYISIINREMN